MNLEGEYKRLKDNIEDNFDYWLDNYIAIDISEAGEVDYLITEIDEYYFCLQLEQELKWCIDDLIDADNRELLIKFVGLKRILNGKMINNKFNNEEDIDRIYGIEPSTKMSETKKKVNHSYIKLNRKITDANTTIEELHKELLNSEYIECDLKTFKSLFSKSGNPTQIVWLRRLIDLLGLLLTLQNKNVISSNNLSIPKIALTFFKKKSKQLKLRSLEVSCTKARIEVDKYQSITEIVTKIVELN